MRKEHGHWCHHKGHANLKELVLCGFTGVHRRFDELELITMTTQADLDAVTTSLETLKDTLTADDSAIQKEIADLQAANPSLDLTGLQAAVADVTSAVDATTALVPSTPTDSDTDTTTA